MTFRPIHYYLIGTASWFSGFAIQGVMFAWLVAMVLHETPEMVGIAQMTLLLPGTVLILLGGSYADRFGGRRVAIIGQCVAVCAVGFLTFVVATDALSTRMMLTYALIMGCAQAFVTPARDGLLNQVAEGRVQRTVMLASFVQFGMQMIGFLIASLADRLGAVSILAAQAVILCSGIIAYWWIKDAPRDPGRSTRLMHSLKEGARTVFSSSSMRMVMVQNVAMAVFFMGSYIVTMPILLRDVFAGSARDLAFMNVANSLGLVVTILLLLRIGDIHRQGRALLLAQGVGAAVLAGAGYTGNYLLFIFVLFIWGVCGGVAMTMSRTIMQVQAPENQRSRVMSFYALSFMGAGPVGALVCGYLVELLGPQMALLVASCGMLSVMLIVAFGSALWALEGHVQPAATAEGSIASAGARDG
ncbi:MAG: MFS transporter [Pseudomonadales bacterium]|nr:MFS transporter [Pseudomonadales bacterium]